MPRPMRADYANGLHHAVSRDNARTAIFKKDVDAHSGAIILTKEALDRGMFAMVGFIVFPSRTTTTFTFSPPPFSDYFFVSDCISVM